MGKTKRFACPEANLLPVTKFVGNGLLIKCLGQVDLFRTLYCDITLLRPLPRLSFSTCFSLILVLFACFSYTALVVLLLLVMFVYSIDVL